MGGQDEVDGGGWHESMGWGGIGCKDVIESVGSMGMAGVCG